MSPSLMFRRQMLGTCFSGRARGLAGLFRPLVSAVPPMSLGVTHSFAVPVVV